VQAGLKQLERLDHRLLLGMRTHGHGDPRVERAIARFSQTGEHAAFWFALGGAGYLLSEPGGERRRGWRRGLIATAAGWGLNSALKLTVRRRRPQLDGLPALTPVISSLSFPSAHSTASFAAASVYSRALPGAAPVLYSLAGAFAASRPYLGVHYPSDVVAGAALGSIVGRLVRTLCR
jgi:undecaprenyl-diphosphatase